MDGVGEGNVRRVNTRNVGVGDYNVRKVNTRNIGVGPTRNIGGGTDPVAAIVATAQRIAGTKPPPQAPPPPGGLVLKPRVVAKAVANTPKLKPLNAMMAEVD